MYFNSVISDTTKLLKPSLVFAFAIAAGVCGLTQITQYRSHPVDVYAGFVIGAGIAAYLVRVRPQGRRLAAQGRERAGAPPSKAPPCPGAPAALYRDCRPECRGPRLARCAA